MASKKVLAKSRKVNKKSKNVPSKKTAVRTGGAKKVARQAKSKSTKVKASRAKLALVRQAKAKRRPIGKKPVSAKRARSGAGQANRKLAMVRRAASAPVSGRNKSASAADLKKKTVSPSTARKAAAISNTSATESKLTASELEHYRALLVEKRRELLGDMGSMENTAFNSDGHSSSPIHMADVGTDNFEQEFTLGLLESERQTLREIHEAIERIDNGTFGICVATGKPIGRARLEAKPWAKHCIEYARQLEQGHISRTGESMHQHDEGEDDDD